MAEPERALRGARRWVEQDPLAIWRSVQEAIAAAMRQAEAEHGKVEVKALGITNQREPSGQGSSAQRPERCDPSPWTGSTTLADPAGMQSAFPKRGLQGPAGPSPAFPWHAAGETTVVWDRQSGAPLHHAIVWLDNRTAGVCAAAAARCGGVDGFRGTTGLPVSTYFSSYKLRWLLDHAPAVADAAADGRLMFGTVDSWLIYNLTGALLWLCWWLWCRRQVQLWPARPPRLGSPDGRSPLC